MNQNVYTARLKALLKLSISRLKIMQQKKTAINKQSRRNLTSLLEAGKVDACRIRIENLWQDDISVELLEILELYCELVLARTAQIADNEIRDQRLEEAIHVLLYASQFVEVKELLNLKPLIAFMVTKDYVEHVMETTDGIPEKVLNRIHVEVPSSELVDAYLLEICKAYEISVPGIYEAEKKPEPEVSEPVKKDEEKSLGEDSVTPELPSAPSKSPSAEPEKTKDTSTDDLWARFAALKK